MPNGSASATDILLVMAEGRAGQGDEEAGPRIGRRGFIGAGLAGAGAALIAPPSGAAAQSAPTVADPQPRKTQAAPEASPQDSAQGFGGPDPASADQGVLSQPARHSGRPRGDGRDTREAGAPQRAGDTGQAGPDQAVHHRRPDRDRLRIPLRGHQRRREDDRLDRAREEPPDRSRAGRHRADRQADPRKEGPEATSTRGNSRRSVPLEQPEQFSISWTSFPTSTTTGLPSLPTWTSSLTDADAATDQFWPMIAQHGFGYNLIIPEKVTGASVNAVRRNFPVGLDSRARGRCGRRNALRHRHDPVSAVQSRRPSPALRGSYPSTITLLKQDPQYQEAETDRRDRLRVSRPEPSDVHAGELDRRGMALCTTGGQGLDLRLRSLARACVPLASGYRRNADDDVQHLPRPAIPIYQLLAPQSKFCIPFDDVLLLLWSEIAPPTPMANFLQFLELTNDYAAGRNYFDDDPKVTLKQLGLYPD